MLQETKSTNSKSILAAPLSAVTRLTLRFPLGTLVLAIVTAVLSIGWTVNHLGFRTSRLDLLNPNSSYNKLWINYINEFGNDDDVVVVVESSNPETVIPVLKEISHALSQKKQFFRAVLHEIDLTKIHSKGLHFLSSDELRQTDNFLARIQPILNGKWELLNLGRVITGLNVRLQASLRQPDRHLDPTLHTDLANLVNSLSESLQHPDQYHSPWQSLGRSLSISDQIHSEYLLANEGRLGFVLLQFAEGEQSGFSAGDKAIGELRRLIDRIQTNHSSVRIGLTGLPVMEYDEMATSQHDMVYSGIISLIGVASMFVAGFGGVRHPVMTVIALLLALAWSFGFVTSIIGHLNILSMSFAVILIGLGIDFGIHYVARYLQLRSNEYSCVDALVQTSQRVGPGIIIGGVTTAIAFLTAGLTDFTGIAELGIIAGGGILFCIIAALVVLPAMIYFSDRHVRHIDLPEPFHAGRVLAPLFRYPFLIFLLALSVCMSFASGVPRLHYDHNLLNLQPVGLESVQLERKLLEETDQSVWFALSMSDNKHEILERKQQFLQLSSVDRTEEIVSFLPPEDPAKQAFIFRIYQRIQQLPRQPPLIPDTPPEQLERQLATTEQLIYRSQPLLPHLQREITSLRQKLRRVPLDTSYSRLSHFQQRMARDLLNRLSLLRTQANPDPPSLNDLPPSLVTRFVGKNNHHLLKIYSRGDIWDMDELDQFVSDVKRIDPSATGKPLQTYFASRQMQQSYIQAAIYALIAVFIVLMLDFRHLGYVLLVLIPVGMGTLMMFGAMGLMDIPLNPANMIVLPLILGIGIDDGVHVVHDFRNQPSGYSLSDSTATAILLTSLTTMIGFGSLMLASHLGLQSLGRVLTIGVSCCLFTSLIMLPALLSWISQVAECHVQYEIEADRHEEQSDSGKFSNPIAHQAISTSAKIDSTQPRTSWLDKQSLVG